MKISYFSFALAMFAAAVTAQEEITDDNRALSDAELDGGAPMNGDDEIVVARKRVVSGGVVAAPRRRGPFYRALRGDELEDDNMMPDGDDEVVVARGRAVSGGVVAAPRRGPWY